jgi:cell division protein FtsW
MGQKFYFEQIDQKALSHETRGIIAVTLALSGIGLAMLLSASFYRGAIAFRDPYYFFRNQIVFLVVGLVGATILTLLPQGFIRKIVPFLFLGSFILLLLVFIPGIGLNLLGGRRWIRIASFTFQPSELMKIGLILHLANLLSRRQEKLGDVVNTLMPSFVIIISVFLLVLAQNDFSSSVLILGLGFLMLFISGIPMIYLTGILFSGGAVGLMLLLTRESRVERLLTFLAPERDPIGAGFQVLSSQIALSNGGLMGLGIGQGVRKLGALPEANSDYIFAVVGEELGYLGIISVFMLFGLLGWYGYRIAYRQGRTFSGLAVFGLTTSILMQALLNAAVVGGLLPPTGLTLPFFSSGGSSLIVSLIAIGFIIHFSKYDETEESLGVSNG